MPYQYTHAPFEITATDFTLEPPLEAIDLLQQTLRDVKNAIARTRASSLRRKAQETSRLALIENCAEHIPREEASEKLYVSNARPAKRMAEADIDVVATAISCAQVEGALPGSHMCKRSRLV